jgi:hypothetical protein
MLAFWALVWGFYGNYDKNALAEARGIVDHMTNKGMFDHNGQMLMAFIGEGGI